ncbi:hypothetical protein I4F81_011648 [Pyropia yezoensis]|uniref:Uncharacterized protein n=1 Tax=Pyropia yezoensis TaxID=2788 RepID=A0ACC3CG57_PYRYE|nr:hypothetical protein I4F81_011648 [Neopyropia yezoensis]
MVPEAEPPPAAPPPGGDAAPGGVPPPAPPPPRLTQVIRRAVFQLDATAQPDGWLIDWSRASGDPPADALEVTRPGGPAAVGAPVHVLLYVDHHPPRVALSPHLAALLGVRAGCRAAVFGRLWQYIRKHRLPDAADRGVVRLNEGLRALVVAATGVPPPPALSAAAVFEVAKLHMGPPPPVRLRTTVGGPPVVYDVTVDMAVEGGGAASGGAASDTAAATAAAGVAPGESADPAAAASAATAAAAAKTANELLESLAAHRRRRDFFAHFADHPSEAINQLVLTQTREAKSPPPPAGERRAVFYTQPWVHEAIPRYLFRKQIADATRAVPDGPAKEVSVTVVPGPPPRSSMRR